MMAHTRFGEGFSAKKERATHFLNKSLLCFALAFSICGIRALALSFVFQIGLLKPAISTSLYP
jgi:hypothetical protein